jgi:hypothetical protein
MGAHPDRHRLDDCPDCGRPMVLVLEVLGGPDAPGGGAFRFCERCLELYARAGGNRRRLARRAHWMLARDVQRSVGGALGRPGRRPGYGRRYEEASMRTARRFGAARAVLAVVAGGLLLLCDDPEVEATAAQLAASGGTVRRPTEAVSPEALQEAAQAAGAAPGAPAAPAPPTTDAPGAPGASTSG